MENRVGEKSKEGLAEWKKMREKLMSNIMPI